MKFKKEELHFLNLFSIYQDNSINGDKIKILVDNEKIYFCQSSARSKIFYTIENVDKIENSEYVFIANQFISLIKMCRDNSSIEIKDDFIVFEDGAKYQISNYEYDEIHPKKLLENFNIENHKTITDTNKINNIKSFIGKDVGYNNIAIMDNNFVSYNDQVLAFTNTNNNIQSDCISNNMLPLISYFNLEEIKVYNIDDDFDHIQIDNVNAFFERQENQIPYIFDDDIKESYEHSNSVSINTEDFRYKLKRINIASRATMGNKISIMFKENKVILKTIETPIAEEIIAADIDKELFDFYVIAYMSDLMAIMSHVKDENVELYITPDINEVRTIVFKSENSDSTYISRLAKNIQ